MMNFTQAAEAFSLVSHSGKKSKQQSKENAAPALTTLEVEQLNKYWHAANYLTVGQIYLMENPLLRVPLLPEHCKPRLLGHWGTSPGLSFLYAHLNRIIIQRDVNVLYLCGPGHGGPAVVANVYLEGTYSEFYPNVGQDVHGLEALFKQFSFPGGISSHCGSETPGSIHEGGELGYSLSHAYGAAFDNPNLIVACIIGDGEAETGPLAAAWHSNKWINPSNDGAVLPILHLNGWKIANPTVLSRISNDELAALMIGYGHMPIFVEGRDPTDMHHQLSAALNQCFDMISAIQQAARGGGNEPQVRPLWPMVVFVSPKGWTGPKVVAGLPVEGTWRSHQVPFGDVRDNPANLKMLEDWLKSYKPDELFDKDGRFVSSLQALAPKGKKRMGNSPYTNAGVVQELVLPPFQSFAVDFVGHGTAVYESTRAVGEFLAAVVKANPNTIRIFGPDETVSNRLGAVVESSERCWFAERKAGDDHLSVDGRVMEILSEHTIEGWVEGMLLTGRHAFFSTYEAFAPIVDSMINQHAKWLKTSSNLSWRLPIPSLNILLTSHVWRQDHNGFSHQDPGLLDHVSNKPCARIYLPPDANTLLYITDRCLRSKQLINVIVAGKHPADQWLDMEQAEIHSSQGIGIWRWASTDQGVEPDVIIASAGDVPTLEALAAVDILITNIPSLRIRFVNVIDLLALEARDRYPHGLTDLEFDSIFSMNKPVVFAFHGYPALIHRLIYRRRNHQNFHVRGYQERGTTTTPFDMLVLNRLSRFHLAISVIDRVPRLQSTSAHLRQSLADLLVQHKQFIAVHGDDMPLVKNWKWSGNRGGEL